MKPKFNYGDYIFHAARLTAFIEEYREFASRDKREEIPNVI